MPALDTIFLKEGKTRAFMKIAFFTDTYEPQVNGVVTSINSFAKELRKRGHEVHIFCPASGNLKESKFIHTTSSVKFYPYPEYRIGLPRGKFYGITEKIQPDIIHVHSPGPIGLDGVALAKNFKIPLFATYHTMLIEFLQYIPGSFISKDLSEKTINAYTKWFFNLADFVFAPGKTAKNYLWKIGVRVPIEILQTGVKLKKFLKIKKLSLPTILHVGRLSSEKNVDLILRVFAKIKGKTSAKLVITSDGPARQELEKLAHDLGISDSVNFSGYISEKEKENLYRKSEIFIMASAADTQGLTALEAMSFGLPVIAAKSGGLTDFISNGKNGLFFSPGSEEDLAGKILKLLKNKNLRTRFSASGKTTAAKFSAENMAGRLESFYSEKLSNKKISVIIPAYLEEKYIEKTLKAVRAQSYKNFEIIVVDSNSKDRTRAIARRYADKVINIKKRGVGIARNVGAKVAKGELFLFLDADTIMEKDFLKKISKAFDDKNVVATSGYIYTSGSLLDRIIFSGTSEISWLTTLIGKPLFYGMCIAVRKNAFEKVHGFDEIHETAEDINFAEKLGKIGKCVLVRKARAFTYPRRTQMMGRLYSVVYHIANYLRYKITGEGNKGYPVAR